MLKLTGCVTGQFTCADGECVDMSKRCDQMSNCKDKSDEMDCKIVNLEKHYNKKIPPFDESTKAKINVSIALLSINDIRIKLSTCLTVFRLDIT